MNTQTCTYLSVDEIEAFVLENIGYHTNTSNGWKIHIALDIHLLYIITFIYCFPNILDGRYHCENWLLISVSLYFK